MQSVNLERSATCFWVTSRGISKIRSYSDMMVIAAYLVIEGDEEVLTKDDIFLVTSTYKHSLRMQTGVYLSGPSIFLLETKR